MSLHDRDSLPPEALADAHDARVAFARRFVAEQRPGMKAQGRITAEVARVSAALALWDARGQGKQEGAAE